ncbi:MAG: hypothetical protein K2X39_07950 [Silvanigrellaceae bacterium]|nr:hypothetical protein [Silvanigrellaceae bacterium]
MKIINYTVSLISLLMLAIGIIYFVLFKHNFSFLNAKASQEIVLNPTLTPHFPKQEHFAHYMVSLNEFYIGLFTGSVGDLSTGFPASYNFQFIEKIDGNQIVSELSGDFNYLQKDSWQLKQHLTMKDKDGLLFKAEESFLQEEKIPFTSEKNNSKNIFANIFSFLSFSVSNHLWKREDSILFYFKRKKDENAGEFKFFTPIAKFFGKKDLASFIYSENGFLNRAVIPISGDFTLKFEKIPTEAIQDFLSKMPKNPINLKWLLEDTKQQNKISLVQNALKICASEINNINNEVVNLNMNPSYIFTRKIISLANFCSTLSKDISNEKYLDDHSKNLSDSFYFYIRNKLRSFIQVHTQDNPYELPEPFLQPDLFAYLEDKNLSFLWPKFFINAVVASIDEIKDGFKVEKDRKKIVELHLMLKNQEPGVVVLGEIEMVSCLVKVLTNPSPREVGQNLSQVDGVSYYRNANINFPELCKNGENALELDLTQQGKSYFDSTHGERLIWNEYSKIKTAKKFLSKASVFKDCNTVIFRILDDQERDLKSVLTDVRKNLFQESFLIRFSNNIPKKIVLMPGKYIIRLSSTVTKQKIGSYEFTIPDTKLQRGNIKVFINVR